MKKVLLISILLVLGFVFGYSGYKIYGVTNFYSSPLGIRIDIGQLIRNSHYKSRTILIQPDYAEYVRTYNNSIPPEYECWRRADEKK